MLYNLKNGKTINLTLEQFLKMSDSDYSELEGENIGYFVEDPFYDSVLEDVDTNVFDTLLEDIEELPEDFFENEKVEE